MVMATCLLKIWTRAYKDNKKSYPYVRMNTEAYGEIDDMVVAPAVKYRCKHFGTISIHSITTTLKA